jgi:DNA polymerase-3 subunit delta
MAEIVLKALKAHLSSVLQGKSTFAPVYLLHGDEYLYKQALADLLDRLLPEAERSMRCTTLDGSDTSLQQAINELNTYALLPGRKVVIVSETRVFYSQKNKAALLEKARNAAVAGRPKAAAAPFLAYLHLAGWTLADVAATGPASGELKGQWGAEQLPSLTKLLEYCSRKGLEPHAGTGGADLLAAAVERGFPKDHHLVLTTDLADKRRKLYKLLKADGVIVDCGVPKGSRFADKQAQEQVLKEQVQTVLNPRGKTLAPQVFAYICEVTGFDLRTFTQNLEKLAVYVGERPQITLEDARRVLSRTRSDPIFELTNALFLRDADGALFYLRSMLKQELQPLQILGAIVNQLRKVLMAKEFANGAGRRLWVPGMPFARFKTAVMPALMAFDQSLTARIEAWSEQLKAAPPEGAGKAKGKSKGKGKALTSDLVLAKGPQSAYPVYQLLLKADKFSLDELLIALTKAQQVDRRLKGGRLDPALAIEDLLFSICHP